ncbi:SRPBCC domain-containing protein [Plantactinospora sp. KBS50]|uniref:SRPBCC family protein n=1 Tax=Plantactinospora sp. KBS50 TaxID=2024580 RepID=UPI0012FE6412|nr:SRPBCC domain-containing protein [Plantactinospora sp. KBS50]
MLEFTLAMPIPAPRQRVWTAWTHPESLADWFWPTRFNTVAELDLRPDGRYRISGPGGGIAVAGVYRDVDRPDRLAFTWCWDGEAQETFVTVRLHPLATGTEVSVCHRGFVEESDRANHVDGWEACLDRLREDVRRDPLWD